MARLHSHARRGESAVGGGELVGQSFDLGPRNVGHLRCPVHVEQQRQTLPRFEPDRVPPQECSIMPPALDDAADHGDQQK